MAEETELTCARFAELVEAYGAELRRWPAALRIAARRLAAREPDLARSLENAAGLDALLDTWRVPGPGAALARAAIAAAPARHAAARFARWWTGLGLAGAALAGSLSGAAAITIAPPPPLKSTVVQPAEAIALFDDPQPDEAP